MPTTLSSTDDASTLAGIRTTQPVTTIYAMTTTDTTITNADVNTTSEGYSSTLGMHVWLDMIK